MFMHDSDSAKVLMIRTIMAMAVTTRWCAADSHTSRCNTESRVSVSMFGRQPRSKSTHHSSRWVTVSSV